MGCVIFMFVRMYWEAKNTMIQVEHLYHERLPESWDHTSILFISDIHRRTISENWIKELTFTHTDIELVLVGGDYTERGGPLERVRHNMKLLRSVAPVYAVHGNHDYNADYREVDIVLRECGVHLLDNEAVWLEKEDAGVWLAGVDDVLTERAKLRVALSEPNLQPAFTMLLVHDPSIVQQLHDERIHLMFAGHTHGGQFRLPWIGPLVSSGIYRRYSYGTYELDRTAMDASEGGTKIFISRGMGTSHIPLRLFCPAEVHIIKLHSKKKQSSAPA
jgi:predicted MPP superfamily phosphohydrolase